MKRAKIKRNYLNGGVCHYAIGEVVSVLDSFRIPIDDAPDGSGYITDLTLRNDQGIIQSEMLQNVELI